MLLSGDDKAIESPGLILARHNGSESAASFLLSVDRGS